jgi:hypothetical protein
MKVDARAASSGHPDFPPSVVDAIETIQPDARVRSRTSRTNFARYLADVERAREAIMSDIFDSASYRKSVRRQFRMSVILVAGMAFAAFALGFSMPIGSTPDAPNIDDDAVFFGRLVAMDGQ